MIKHLFVMCLSRDVLIWIKAAPLIPRYIASENYIVIVPDHEVGYFDSLEIAPWQVHGESRYIQDIDLKWVEQNFVPAMPKRAGWYWQQLVKIAALASGEPEDINLVWDGDSIPCRKIDILSEDNKITYHISILETYNNPQSNPLYFESINKILGYDQQCSVSFIYPCFPMRVKWTKELIKTIEERSGTNWTSAIAAATQKNSQSGFSEFELMGNYLFHTHRDQIHFKDSILERFGSEFTDLESLNERQLENLANHCDLVSFENWTCAFSENHLFPNFLFYFSRAYNQPKIIQIGANDGITEDPLRYFLTQFPDSVDLILIEPLPYYVEKLRSLYAENHRVEILEVAIGTTKREQALYSIPPEIADQMNGDGPANNWAHGSGSFDKQSVINGINANSFRGDLYRDSIELFCDSIIETKVPVIPLSEIDMAKQHESLLLVIDVQGAEMEVLNSIDWNHPPQYIYCEDDQGGEHSKAMADFFKAHGYKYKFGTFNKFYLFVGVGRA